VAIGRSRARTNGNSTARREGEMIDLDDDAFIVRALSRGLRILALFTVDHPEWGLNELSQSTGLHKATVYRMTRTMEAEGFLVFDPGTNRYHLGPSILPVTYLASSQNELIRLARPYLEELAEETGETANMAVEQDGSVVVVGQVLTPHLFKPVLPVGRVMSDLANAHAKVFLAMKAPAEQEKELRKPLARLTSNTVTDPRRVREEIQAVARDGVAFDLEEHSSSVCSVAAPVWDRNGEVRATLSVVAPTERFGPEEMKRHVEVLKRIAADMSAYLGYSQW
jgi:DNA-binding IclR family transcriptional regulator